MHSIFHTRISTVIGICVGILVLAASFLRGKPNDQRCFRCNVIVIMIDDLRANSLPCYGYRSNTAPNLCAFAKSNIIFSRTFANSSWTLPSEFSIFTSAYPSNHGMGVTLQNILNDKAITMTQLFQRAGYATIFVGNNQPSIGLKQGIERGFNSIRITPNELDSAFPTWLHTIDDISLSNAKHRPAFIFFHTDNVRNYVDHLTQMGSTYPLDPAYRPIDIPPMHFTPELREFTLSYLKEHILFHTGTATREQYESWYENLRSARSLYQAERIFDELPSDDKSYAYSHVIGPQLADRDFDRYAEFARHVYDEHIRRTDGYLGQLFDKLKANNLLRNSIVIISSEHGEMIGENGYLGHGVTMYNPLIHVPFILHIPRRIPARIQDLSQLIDLYPTVMEYVGISPVTKLAGISLKNAIENRNPRPKNDFVISEWTNQWNAKTIQSASQKLIRDIDHNGKLFYELYDLTTDAHEQQNLALDHPDTVASLSRTIDRTINGNVWYEPIQRGFPDWIDDAHRKKLIETGYFNGP